MLEPTLLLLACAQPDPDWSKTIFPEAVPASEELASVVVASGVPGELHHLGGEPLLINGLGVRSAEDQLLTPGWARRGAVVGEQLWVADAESGVAIVAAEPLRITQSLPLGYVADVAAFDGGALVLLRFGGLVHLSAQGKELARWPIAGDPRELAAWQEQGRWRWAAAAGAGGVVHGDANGPEGQHFFQNSIAIAAGPVAGGLSGLLTDDAGTIENLGVRLSSGLRAQGALWFSARGAGVWHGEMQTREGAQAVGLSESQGLVWVSWSDGLIQGLDPLSGEQKQSLRFDLAPIERVSRGHYNQGSELRALPDHSLAGQLPALPYALAEHEGTALAALGAGLVEVNLEGNHPLTGALVRDAASSPEGLWWGEVERGLCGPPGCSATLHGDASAVHTQARESGTWAAGFSRYDGSVVLRAPEGQITHFQGRGMGQDMVLLGDWVVVSERGLGLAYTDTPGQWQTLPLTQGDPIFGREQRLCVRENQVMVTLAEYGVAILEPQGPGLALIRQVNTAGLALSCASAGAQGWWVADRAGLSLVRP